MLIAVDTETTGLDLRHGCKPFIVATCDENGNTRVWEWPVQAYTREVIVNIQEISEIRSYLKGHTLIFHNAKFDLRALSTINLFFDFQEDRFSTHTLGQLPEDGHSPLDPFAKRTQEADKQIICLPIPCPTFDDTLLMSHALRTEDEHGLKELCLRYLRYSDLDELELKKEVERCTRVAKKKCPEVCLGHSPTGDRMTGYDYWIPRFAEPDNDVCRTYAIKDVERTMLLYHFFIDLLDDAEEQVRYGYEREKRLMQTVYRMEDGGVTVNPKTIKSKIRKAEKCSQEYLGNCSVLMRKKLGGTKTYNPRSQKDLTSYLYSPEGWSLTPPKTTDKGSPSTDKASLEALIESLPEDKRHKDLREFLGMFLQAKSHLSAIGYLRNYQSYALPLPKPLSIPEELRNRDVLYPSLNQTGTKTTRFSSSNPNGQNVCVHPDTEILTEAGWMPAKTCISKTGECYVKVAQYWPDGTIDFVKPTAVHAPHYSGDLVQVSTEQQIQFTVTPNHRCLVQNRKTGELLVTTAENFPVDYKIPKAGWYCGGHEQLTQAEIVFLCALQADGSYHHAGGIKFVFKKPRKILRFRQAILDLGCENEVKESKKNGVTIFYVSRKGSLYRLAKEWLPEKVFSGYFLSLTRENLIAICEQLMFWDGDFTRKACYSSSQKENADWAQIFFTLCNYRANLVERTPETSYGRNKHYYVNVCDRNYALTSNRTIKKFPYEGRVYCVTVPSEFIIIRENGRVCITGNSKISTVEIAGQTYDGPKIREVFSPLENLEWWAIDYSQLELRVFAACSEEQSLIDTLDDGYDFHSFVAERIFNKPPDKITKQERRIAKNVNFALIFGASPAKVNLTAGIPNAYELFAKQFPNVASYMQKMIAHAKKHRSVRTLDGYRLGVPADAPYKAVNYIVQGTAGSIIKNAMIEIDASGLVDWETSRIVLQIHDELIVETKKDSPQARVTVAKIIKAMENSGARLSINTPVSCERIVKNWGSGEEMPRTFFFRAKQRKANHA